MSKTVLIVCGTGVATAGAAEYRVKQVLEKNNIDAKVTKVRAPDTATSAKFADVVVALTTLPCQVDIPVVPGLPFLTGIGEEEAGRQLVEYLTKD
jgi:PTS system galactitol-specific IIB component